MGSIDRESERLEILVRHCVLLQTWAAKRRASDFDITRAHQRAQEIVGLSAYEHVYREEAEKDFIAHRRLTSLMQGFIKNLHS